MSDAEAYADYDYESEEDFARRHGLDDDEPPAPKPTPKRTPAATYEAPHWFTKKVQVRCTQCKRVAYPSLAAATEAARKISERVSMVGYQSPKCLNFHVAPLRP